MRPRPPNAFQEVIHRFLMLRPVSALLAVALHRADAIVLRPTKDQHTITEFAGLPIVQLTAVGARNGLPRTPPLVSLIDGERMVLKPVKWLSR